MRELEFLPTWYPKTRRRHRMFRIEMSSALVLVAGLAVWTLLARNNVNNREAALAVVDSQLVQSQLELDQLQVQLKLKGQLELQRQIVSRLGVPIEMSRLIRTLDGLMPKEMSLVEISFDTEERARQTASALPQRSRNGDRAVQMDRWLKVKLLAVAPSDVDLANFLAGLTATPFFNDVALTFGRDRSEGGHMMREFEVTFSMALNPPTSSN